jgi:coproporphyrinogen III oxidase
MKSIDITELKNFFWGLQDYISQSFETLEDRRFLSDIWTKPDDSPLQGTGRTMIIEDGQFFERGGVAFSHVSGKQLPPSATATRPEIAGGSFEAMGVSLVFHPQNPKVPTVHMNVRCLVAQKEGIDPVWWFGGGMDLTPYYGNVEDCKFFHQTCKNTLDAFDTKYYPQFKNNCDQYFYLPHRQEPRGIGGIFFDDFSELGFEKSFAMTQAVGRALVDAYLPIAQKNKDRSYTSAEKEFQEYRRSRYVEFNLVYDRGTHFGLQSGGRAESILMSMPRQARWEYQRHFQPNTPEFELTDFYLKPRDWLNS